MKNIVRRDPHCRIQTFLCYVDKVNRKDFGGMVGTLLRMYQYGSTEHITQSREFLDLKKCLTAFLFY